MHPTPTPRGCCSLPMHARRQAPLEVENYSIWGMDGGDTGSGGSWGHGWPVVQRWVAPSRQSGVPGRPGRERRRECRAQVRQQAALQTAGTLGFHPGQEAHCGQAGPRVPEGCCSQGLGHGPPGSPTSTRSLRPRPPQSHGPHRSPLLSLPHEAAGCWDQGSDAGQRPGPSSGAVPHPPPPTPLDLAKLPRSRAG